MQQTQKYKLNLIEPTDPFLPEALNQNTQKVEDVLKQTLEPMDQRITVLEGFHCAWGSYLGLCNTSTLEVRHFIELPFTPELVLVVMPRFQNRCVCSAKGDQCKNSELSLQENGFSVYGANLNNNYEHYNFIAFG